MASSLTAGFSNAGETTARPMVSREDLYKICPWMRPKASVKQEQSGITDTVAEAAKTASALSAKDEPPEYTPQTIISEALGSNLRLPRSCKGESLTIKPLHR